MINKNIFRQYDIRGLVDKDLTAESVYLLGKGFGTYLRDKGLKTVAIGGDVRHSSIGFKSSYAKGLVDVGCDVFDVGILATPTLYFSIFKLKTDAGVMITGSHNPPEYNGFKMNIGVTGSIYGDDILKIYDIIKEKNFARGVGSLTKKMNMIKEYQDYIIKNIKLDRPVKVLLDSGNGAGGPIAPAIFKGIGADVVDIYSKPDGNFPNHHPDPTVVEYMQDLIQQVVEGGFELGIGLDGDADRIGVVDENGEMLFGDEIMNIFARDFLVDNPGQKVVADVKTSKTFYDDIAKRGGVPIMYKTGHSMIKEKMSSDKILLGGEMSGHIFFKDRYLGFDDAIYASCRFMEILAKADKPVSKLLEDIPKMVSTPEIRVDCPDEIKFDLVEKVKNSFIADGCEVIDIDGMRLNFPDGWGLLRPSNTQPVLVLRFEAKTQKKCDKIQKLVEDRIESFK